jgi:hypothetical protein
MTDLTEITTAYGLLDEETRKALDAALNSGAVLQIYTRGGNWRNSCARSDSRLCRGMTYRAQPVDLTMDVYPWPDLHKNLKWCARDADWNVFGWKAKPHKGKSVWFGEAVCRIDGRFAHYIPGTVDWKDSLQQRPEGV